jgi:hypothetical protein
MARPIEEGVKMDWTELLNREIETTYKSTEGLLDLVDDHQLDWKPSTGSNWMTTGQLLHHLSDACGAPFRGFVTGEWGMPGGASAEEMSPEEMLPSAERMPALGSVDETRRLLVADKQLALDMLARCSEERLATEMTTAPWDPTEMALGYHLLDMVQHLKSHQAQLFYYLKLQGVPVHTGHLWGM